MKRALVLSFVLAAPVALAHEDEPHPPGEHHDAPKVPPPPPQAQAPGDHAHASPHGGVVVTVDKETHVEVVFGERAFTVYFYDAHLAPVALPTDAKGTVVIGKEVKKVVLPIAKKPDGTLDDHLVGELAVAADRNAAVVIQATVLGKARSVRVEKPAAAAAPAPKPPAPAATK